MNVLLYYLDLLKAVYFRTYRAFALSYFCIMSNGDYYKNYYTNKLYIIFNYCCGGIQNENSNLIFDGRYGA